MIFEKKVLNSELKYDTDEEKLYRLNKKQQKWTHVNPGKHYCKRYKKDVFNNILIDAKYFFIHRLIYYICNDNFDIFNSKIEIDHRNGDHNDNRLENLRIASHQEQMRNTHTINGKDIKGYSETKCGTFVAQLKNENGKKYGKTFKTEELARKYYLENKIRF